MPGLSAKLQEIQIWDMVDQDLDSLGMYFLSTRLSRVFRRPVLFRQPRPARYFRPGPGLIYRGLGGPCLPFRRPASLLKSLETKMKQLAIYESFAVYRVLLTLLGEILPYVH